MKTVITLSLLIIITASLSCTSSQTGPTLSAAKRPTDFGTQWVRSHPYTLMGLCLNNEPHNVTNYTAAGFNHMLAWRPKRDLIMAPTVAANLTWFGNLPFKGDMTEQGYQSTIDIIANLVEKYPGNVGWFINDEPTLEQMPLTGKTLAWIRQTYPDKLALSNLGGNPDYPQHARDFLRIVNPDILMFDNYPFTPTQGPLEDPQQWFHHMGTVRREALAAGVPYWACVQSIDRSTQGMGPIRNYFSESDLRVQLFTYLTYGYTGQTYFMYDYWASKKAPGLMGPGDQPSHTYFHAATANPEVRTIGNVIRYLTSTHIFAVTPPNQIPITDPETLPIWTPTATPDSPIKAINIIDPAPRRHGLIGLFTDDNNQNYFMLTNLRCEHGQEPGASQNTKLSFQIILDPTVKSILRLNRHTGKTETLKIQNPQQGLTITLPGGTGDLFKYNTGPFPGLKD